jgi:hypothetical protein
MPLIPSKEFSQSSVTRMSGHCPVCRTVQMFDVYDIEERTRLGILGPVGPATRAWSVQQEARCDGCGLILERVPSDDPERLALEEKVRSDPKKLAEPERLGLIGEAIRAFEWTLKRRKTRQINMDRETALGCLGTLALLVLFVWLAIDFDLEWAYFGPGILVGLGLWAVVTVAGVLTSKRRYVRREVMPGLVLSLRALQPERSELDRALSRLRDDRFKIAAYLDAQDLFDATRDVAAGK